MYVIMSGHFRGGSNFVDLFRDQKPKYLIHDYGDFPKNYVDCYKHYSEKDCTHISESEVSLYQGLNRPETNIENCLNMFRKRFVCISDFNLLSKEYDDNDLYIYIRPDLSLEFPPGMNSVSDLCNSSRFVLSNTKNFILIPSGGDFHGGIFDCMAIGSKSSIIKYLNAYSSIREYVLEQKVVFHPETLLRHHLINEYFLTVLRIQNINCILRGNKLNI